MWILRRLLSQVFARQAPPLDSSRAGADSASALEQVRALVKARNLDEALAMVEAVLEGEPENVDALVLSGETLRRRRRIEEAKTAYRRALVLDPERYEAWLDLGTCHYLEKDYFWARFYYRTANTLAPGSADVWNELGLIEILLGNYDKAAESLNTAVNIEPEHAEAWNNLGLIAARRGEVPTARRHFLRATFIRPDYYVALVNLGIALRNLEQIDEAEDALRRAIEMKPDEKDALLALAGVRQDKGDLGGAEEALERALAPAPQDSDALSALSDLRLRQGDVEGAESAARAALRADPEHAQAGLALAHAQLSRRDFAAGWDSYEARLRAHSGVGRVTPFPRWQGEPLAGRAIYVYGEQGIGDEIMFASCLPDLAAGGARCVLDCEPRLRALFRRSFPSIELLENRSQVQASGDADSAGIDFASPIGSLPRFLRRNEADFPGTPYLVADAQKCARWSARLSELGPGMKVGIAWRGGLARTGRAQRSLSYRDLRDLLGVPGVRWVSLQHRYRGDAESAEPEASELAVAQWPDALADMDETAALMSSLDLVITVCSSLVHLGGALGCPVWVLTPYAPPWRYLRSGPTMPWYRSVRLVRQGEDCAWEGPIAAVTGDLRRLAVEEAAAPCR